MATPIIQSADENILRDAAWSGTAPEATYSLDTLERIQPSARILFGATSATITATIASRRGDVLAIPVSNATGLTLTNGAGLSEAIPIPTLPASRIPLTIVCDLTVLEPNPATRTSTTWTFAFTGSANILLGGAILIYNPLTEFASWDFLWGSQYGREAFGVQHENEYGSVYVQRHRTHRRDGSLRKLLTQNELDAMLNWFDTSCGPYGVSLLWPDPLVNDGLVGQIGPRLEYTLESPSSDGIIYASTIGFREFGKGEPI